MKLGAATTLEAARMLAAVEVRDQFLGPQISDLSQSDPSPHVKAWSLPTKQLGIAVILGGLLMITVALAILLQGSTPSSHGIPPTQQDDAEQFLSESFDLIDRDKSGFIEHGEEPPIKARRIRQDGSKGETEAGDADAWMRVFDRDGDGRASKPEYVAHLLPGLLERGLPTNWMPRTQADPAARD